MKIIIDYTPDETPVDGAGTYYFDDDRNIHFNFSETGSELYTKFMSIYDILKFEKVIK